DTGRSFYLTYLDKDLALLDQLEIPKTDGSLWDISISGVSNYPNELLVYCYAHEFEKGDYVASINKIVQTVELKKLDLDLPKSVRLIKAFTYGDQFIRLYIDYKNEALLLRVFEREKLVHSESYPMPYPELVDELKRSAVIGIPRMLEDRLNSVAIGARKQKLYTLDHKVILSVEDEVEGVTRLFTFHTNRWEMNEETYVYPDFNASEGVVQINSVIFDDMLYQGMVDGNGLTLSQIDMAEHQIMNQVQFEDDDQLKNYLGSFSRKSFTDSMGNGVLNVQKQHTLMERLGKSLSLSIYLNPDDQPQLTIGSHDYLGYYEQRSFEIASATFKGPGFFLGGENFYLGGGKGWSVGFDPYPFFDFATDLAFLSGDNKYFYGETLIDLGNLESLGAVTGQTSYDKAIQRYLSFPFDFEGGTGITFFQWEGETVLGFLHKKEYRLLAFD
ncbi:MAG: hypothetical protein AAFY70_18650, partial [Bacteroidota bacterium]